MANGLQVPMHPMLDLLNNPTPQHSGAEMLSALLVDFNLHGTAYWSRVGLGAGPPKELWWRPQNIMRPKLHEGRAALAGYEYMVDGKWEPLKVDDVVQVRKGQHPFNPWLGESPLAALAPEVWIDREATDMSAAILENLGIIGQLVSLKDSKFIDPPSPQDVKATRDYFRTQYTGRKRGESLFVGFPIDVHGGTVAQPDLLHPKTLHDFVEERVCAIYRLPAAVVQFGIGLEQATQNATMVQLEKQAWLTGALPDGNLIASQIGRQLMPAFDLDPMLHRLTFDTSGIEALQQNRKDLTVIVTMLVEKGIITRAMGLEMLELPIKPSDHVRHMPIGVIEVPEGKTQLEVDEERRAALPAPTPPQGNASPPNNAEGEETGDEGEGGKAAALAGDIKALSARERQRLLLTLEDESLRQEGQFLDDLIATFEAMGQAAAAAVEGRNG